MIQSTRTLLRQGLQWVRTEARYGTCIVALLALALVLGLMEAGCALMAPLRRA